MGSFRWGAQRETSEVLPGVWNMGGWGASGGGHKERHPKCSQVCGTWVDGELQVGSTKRDIRSAPRCVEHGWMGSFRWGAQRETSEVLPGVWNMGGWGASGGELQEMPSKVFPGVWNMGGWRPSGGEHKERHPMCCRCIKMGGCMGWLLV